MMDLAGDLRATSGAIMAQRWTTKCTWEKKIPSGVRRMSVQRICHSKTMAMRREIGDQMMTRAEEAGTVLTVETLMASPISKFIQFSAND